MSMTIAGSNPGGGDPAVVTVPRAAALLGISKDLAYDLARRGELPGAFQLGRRWLVSTVRLWAHVHGAGGDDGDVSVGAGRP
jgi:excisionase family DNA binding protein